MPSITEKRYTGEAIVSEANGTRSRENVTVISGQNLGANAALGNITASGKYTALNPGAGDGSQTFAGVLYAAVDASGGDAAGVALVRDCEINTDKVDWNTMNAGQKTTAIGQALTLGVIVRTQTA